MLKKSNLSLETHSSIVSLANDIHSTRYNQKLLKIPQSTVQHVILVIRRDLAIIDCLLLTSLFLLMLNSKKLERKFAFLKLNHGPY